MSLLPGAAVQWAPGPGSAHVLWAVMGSPGQLQSWGSDASLPPERPLLTRLRFPVLPPPWRLRTTCLDPAQENEPRVAGRGPGFSYHGRGGKPQPAPKALVPLGQPVISLRAVVAPGSSYWKGPSSPWS